MQTKPRNCENEKRTENQLEMAHNSVYSRTFAAMDCTKSKIITSIWWSRQTVFNSGPGEWFAAMDCTKSKIITSIWWRRWTVFNSAWRIHSNQFSHLYQDHIVVEKSSSRASGLQNKSSAQKACKWQRQSKRWFQQLKWIVSVQPVYKIHGLKKCVHASKDCTVKWNKVIRYDCASNHSSQFINMCRHELHVSELNSNKSNV